MQAVGYGIKVFAALIGTLINLMVIVAGMFTIVISALVVMLPLIPLILGAAFLIWLL